MLKMGKLDTIPTNSNTEIHLQFEDETRDSLELQYICLKACRFLRIGALKAKFTNSTLANCFFEDAYFRNAFFSDVLFTGSKFKNCNLKGVTFERCDFRYCTFEGTLLDIENIKQCMPVEANLRRDLARNLRKNFESIGDKNAADTCLNIEIQAHEEELLNIIKCNTDYYKKNYTPFNQFSSIFGLLLSKLSGVVWGYGHRVKRLISSYLVATFAFSLITYFGQIQFYYAAHHPPKTLTYWEAIYYSFSQTIGTTIGSLAPVSKLAQFFHIVQSFSGYIFLAMLAAAAYKRISR